MVSLLAAATILTANIWSHSKNQKTLALLARPATKIRSTKENQGAEKSSTHATVTQTVNMPFGMNPWLRIAHNVIGQFYRLKRPNAQAHRRFAHKKNAAIVSI